MTAPGIEELPHFPIECTRCHRIQAFEAGTLVIEQGGQVVEVLCARCIPAELERLRKKGALR